MESAITSRLTSEVFIPDRKSTRLNSSHANISYAVFCLKKKKTVVNARMITQSHERPKVLTVISCNPLDENYIFAVRLDSTGLFHVDFARFCPRRFTMIY